MILAISVHVAWLCCFWACREPVHHGGRVCSVELHTSWKSGSRKKNRKGKRTRYTLQSCAPVTYFLYVCPLLLTFHHLPIMPSDYEFINGLSHSWSQSHQYPINFQMPTSWNQAPNTWTYRVHCISNQNVVNDVTGIHVHTAILLPPLLIHH
jgi:hypothetical protein